MNETTLNEVRQALVQRRSTLSQWVGQASDEEKAIALGPEVEPAVSQHISALDESLTRAEAGTLGLCTVCHDYVDPIRLEVDYTASVCLDHLSPEEASGLERELEMAQTVQRSFLPHSEPSIPGLEVAAFTRPAQFVGGDYFDFIPFASGDYGLAVGDVAGHGVSASLHMASLQALLRAVIPTEDSPSQAVRRVHRLFIHNSHYPTFVTFFLAAYNASTRQLRYCNAGHNPPLLFHREASSRFDVGTLDPTGAAIGLVESATYGERSLTLLPGDVLVAYTDGVVEASDPAGRPFGTERLQQAITSAGDSSSRDIIRAITQSLETFVGGRSLADDATLVICQAV